MFRSGDLLVTSESSNLCIWNLKTYKLLLKEFLPDIIQFILWDQDRKLIILSQVQQNLKYRVFHETWQRSSEIYETIAAFVLQPYFYVHDSRNNNHKIILSWHCQIVVCLFCPFNITGDMRKIIFGNARTRVFRDY